MALGRAELQDPEAARERAEFAASFILERLGASEATQSDVKRIVSETIADLVPLAEEIERIRLAEMVLAEEASREITEAFTGFALSGSIGEKRG